MRLKRYRRVRAAIALAALTGTAMLGGLAAGTAGAAAGPAKGATALPAPGVPAPGVARMGIPAPGAPGRPVAAAAGTPTPTPGAHGTLPAPSGPDVATPVELARRNGRIDQFAVAEPPGADPLAGRYLWYRPQLAPGGGYGPWVRLSPHVVNNRQPVVQPWENVDGRIEVFFDSSSTYRVFQATVDGPWSEELFSVASPPWWGGPHIIALPDGRLAYTQTTQHVYSHELGVWYVAQVSPGGPWGTWEYLGDGPLIYSVARPRMAVDPADGTVRISGQLWNASSCQASIQQLPGGGWSAWQADPANPTYCASS